MAYGLFKVFLANSGIWLIMNSNIKSSFIGFAIAVAAMFTSTAVVAYTIDVGGTGVSGEGITTSVVGATVIDFNSGILPSEYSGGAVKSGTSSNSAAPPDDISYYYTVGSSSEQRSPGILTLGSLSKYFGFYGGSPDAYNSIELYSGTELVGSFSGTQLYRIANNCDDCNPGGNRSEGFYWNIWADGTSEFFNVVKFISTSNAFETDNHAYLAAVPIPASAWLFVSGILGLMGFSTRRRSV